MTDAEKGALLLADHQRKEIEFWSIEEKWKASSLPTWFDDIAYRVRPEPVREVVEMYASAKMKGFGLVRGDKSTHRITFETVKGGDGEMHPDCSTIKMESLK